MRESVVRDLERARARTLQLTDPDDPTLLAQHDPLMSPLVWDLAHVGQQEELWLLRAGDPSRPGMLPPEVDSLYHAFKHRRADRPAGLDAVVGCGFARGQDDPSGPPATPLALLPWMIDNRP